MKIYIESNENYILLTDNFDKSNIEEHYLKEELINYAMDKLEELKMSMEIKRQQERNKIRMLKLGIHPSMRKQTNVNN